MTSVIEVRNLTKRYKDTVALDGVSLSIEKDTIYGLLGRNGAGKTTLMSILTAQNFATSGEALVFGEQPYENAGVLSRICFVRESQKYPDDATPTHAFRAARLFFRNWDQTLAEQLIADFQLPLKTPIKKLSRGQLSAVGVIIGLASRAEITFFDEPYLGLDAVARQIFYDRLLEDYSEHPRTIILSSHLIDEVSNLIEKIIVIDGGRILLDEDTDAVRGRASTIVGDAARVEAWAAGREIIHREQLGRVASITVLGHLTADDRAAIAAADLDVATVSLQQLIVRLTQNAGKQDAAQQNAAPAASDAVESDTAVTEEVR
ncbi:ABC transporter ATP-binding protein [Microbacterium sp. YJN-G]|uniref:ABC transporter ATP-binding protein n=1 Tax=Microbacterium sp. YJN-G TaxID=2763257 RepID=UPI0018787030|nr:ABC transporter ATP-binding protein [Microbacterium sp. YJN-G]